jgi:6-phosphogluconolactonase (cycloisomerase 2 family)
MAARTTPNGAFLIATYYGGSTGGSVRSFAVDATGDLTPLSRAALASTSQPVDVVVHPTGRFAFVADSIAATIVVLAIEASTGKLATVGSFACADVSALAVDGTGGFVVAMTSASPGSIQAFAVASNGALTPRGAPLGTGPHSPMAIEVAPDGKTFHVVTANSSLVTAALDAQGNLATTSTAAIPAYGFPSGLALDASGRFVYTANFAGDDVSVLDLANGKVTAGSNVRVTSLAGGGTTQPSWLVTVR